MPFHSQPPVIFHDGKALFDALDCPRMLQVAMTGLDPQTRLTPELIAAVRQTLEAQYDALTTIFGAHWFRRWTINSAESLQRLNRHVDQGLAVRVENTPYSVAFHVALRWENKPNPPGHIPSRATVEEGIGDALAAHVYVLVRLWTGYHSVRFRNRKQAEEQALQELVEVISPLLPISSVNQKANHDDRATANAMRLAERLKDQGAKVAGSQHGKARELTYELYEQGRGLAGRDDEHPPALISTAMKRLKLLVEWRLRARARHLAERQDRSEQRADHTLRNFIAPQIVGSRWQNPSWTEIAWAARAYEFDATELFGSLEWLRPMAYAYRAIGAYERRKVKPEPSSDADDLALHGLRAMRDVWPHRSHPELDLLKSELPVEVVGQLAPD
ncbi:hypothetical protein ABEG18_06315 [Alsobacter sp. KACC 23698]|uniref:Uncharacterized protein n=1 Tax=Alsobacter sp. KACC 23698 TaxID=3149229 RepID=A0AAU7JIY2_9HYPH